tara:strand:- start:78 stop:356 length:279 start_codon:yes stop_codon:yes gene_type:complete
MSEEIKFTEDELKNIKEIQNKYIDIQNAFGQVALSRIKVEEQVNLINEQEAENKKKFEEIQQSEKNFLEEITKKYGDGTLNPESGVFIPNSK